MDSVSLAQDDACSVCGEPGQQWQQCNITSLMKNWTCEVTIVAYQYVTIKIVVAMIISTVKLLLKDDERNLTRKQHF